MRECREKVQKCKRLISERSQDFTKIKKKYTIWYLCKLFEQIIRLMFVRIIKYFLLSALQVKTYLHKIHRGCERMKFGFTC